VSDNLPRPRVPGDHQPWCTDHQEDDRGWCARQQQEVDGVTVKVAEAPAGSVRVYVLHEGLSVTQAEELALLLLRETKAVMMSA
jgi:hypothetical protein